MLRRFLIALLIFSIAGGLDAAKRKKKRPAGKKPKAEVAKVVTPEKEEAESTPPVQAAKEEPASPDAANEMDAYRAIQKRPESTVQDLADLLLMYRSEYAKINSAEKRLARARELNLIKAQKGGDKLERGTLAYAIMRTYNPESGFLFWLTGWERYAIRDVQEASIMPIKSADSQHLSGEQLLGTITAAEEYVEKRKSWGK